MRGRKDSPCALAAGMAVMLAIALTTIIVPAAAGAGRGRASFGRASGSDRAGGRIFDRAFSCTVAPDSAGRHRLSLDAMVATGVSQQGADTAGGVLDLATAAPAGSSNQFATLLGLNGAKSGSLLAPSLCRKTAKAKLVLRRAKLPLNGVFTPTFVGGFSANCSVTTRIIFRARVSFDGSGRPTHAAVVVRDEEKGKATAPVAYVTWTSKRVASYLAPACTSR